MSNIRTRRRPLRQRERCGDWPIRQGRKLMQYRSHASLVRRASRLTRRRFASGIGLMGVLAGTAPFSIARSQSAALKVGVLLPRSGIQAGIGQDCHRGVEIAPGILKDLGLPELAVLNGDTESSVEIPHAR